MTESSKQAVNPKGKDTATGAYSPGIAFGDFVFVAGQGPMNLDTGEFETPDFEHEVRLTLENVRAVLDAADVGFDDLVKVQVHLQNINDIGRFNAIYQSYFTKPYPARTTVQSVLGDISIEIDAIAMRGAGGASRKVDAP